MDSALFGLSLLPTSAVIVSGLFFWLPGEFFLRLFSRSLFRGKSDFLLLLQVPAYLCIAAAAQSMLNHANIALALVLLVFSSTVGLFLRAVIQQGILRLHPAESLRRDLSSDQIVNIAFVGSLYVALLYWVWWLPAGVRGVWVWPLQFEPNTNSLVLLLLSLLIIFCLLITRWRYEFHRFRPVVLLMPVSCVLMQLAAACSQSVDMIQVYSLDKITGYYTASKYFLGIDDLLSRFNALLPQMPYHVVSHPVGKVFFFKISSSLLVYPWNLWFVFGLVVAVSSLASLLAWQLAWRLWSSEPRALLAGILTAILPSIAFFSPLFDVFNVFLSLGLMLCWVLALQSTRRSTSVFWSSCVGLVGYVSLFFAFNMLILGLFLLSAFPVVLSRRQGLRESLKKVGGVIFLASVACIVCGFAVYLSSGYDLLAGLRGSLLMDEKVRPDQYRTFVSRLFNIQELLWGMGGFNFFWISSALIVCFRHIVHEGLDGPVYILKHLSSPRAYLVLQVLAFVVINFLGVLSGETSRLYAIFMPFLLVGVVGVGPSLSLSSALLVVFSSLLWVFVGVWRYQFIW